MIMRDRLLPITGIGSLPHTSIQEAIDFSLKFDIPFLPELTKLEDSKKVKNIDELLCFSSFIKQVGDSKKFKTQSFHQLESNINENQIHFIDDPEKSFTGKNKVGLHCCNSIEISKLEKLEITHLSFDAHLINNPDEFLSFLLRKEITPVIGVISTHRGRVEVCENFSKWKSPLRNYVMDCWLAPACGLAGFSEKDAESVLDLLRSIQREITISHL